MRRRRAGSALVVLAILAALWWQAREDTMVELTRQLELLDINPDAPVRTRWRPTPGAGSKTELEAHFRKLAMDDPPGAPDDEVSDLRADFDVVTEWLGDTFTIVPDTVREGQVVELRGYIRVWSSNISTAVRGHVILDGVEARGGSVSYTQHAAWHTLVIDLPHPASKAWTYEELDRALLGYEVQLLAGTTLDQLTQFYPEIDLETADHTGLGIPVDLGAVAGALVP